VAMIAAVRSLVEALALVSRSHLPASI